MIDVNSMFIKALSFVDMLACCLTSVGIIGCLRYYIEIDQHDYLLCCVGWILIGIVLGAVSKYTNRGINDETSKN